jgi:hypothetical protein
VLGFTWPEADEEKLFALANSWPGLAANIPGIVERADLAAAEVWQRSLGSMPVAFQVAWEAADGPAEQLRLGATGADISAGLIVCASAVLALKLSVIVQLVLLAIAIAQAIATAAPTLGASLLEIPLFRLMTKLVLDQALGLAITAVLNG